MSARGEPPRKKVCREITTASKAMEECKQYRMTERHSLLALHSMKEMWQRGELCDLTLLVGARTFSVHRVVMAGSIPFLRAMLCSGMKESRQQEVRLHEVDEESMEVIVNFCYTGELDVGIESVYPLVAAANLLQMDEVRDACCLFLKSRLSPDNCISTHCFADTHGFLELLAAADNFACKNFDAVVASEEFLSCDVDAVTRLLDSEVVQVPSEERIYHALIMWIEADRAGRSKHVLDLLRCIRFPSLSRSFIESSIIPSELIKSTPNCEAFFQGVLAAHMNPHTKVRLPPVAVYVVGGRNATHCLDSCERYDPCNNTWNAIGSMKQVRTAVTVAQLNGFIYAIGGERETQYSQYGTSYLNSVERYNIKSDVWDNVAPLKTSRSFAASAVLNDLIFVIGGEDGSNYSLLSVEIYNPAKDTWFEGPHLNMRRSGPGCCVVDGCIYVMGGCTAAIENYHMSVECLRPPNEVKDEREYASDCHWTLGKSMTLARSGVAVCALNGHIYACGGRNRSQSIYYKAVECYDCDRNEWRQVQPMHMKRAWAGSVVCGGLIYVFGGYDGVDRLDSVESFDPVTETWSNVDTTMAFQRAGCAAAVT
ncbi:kelch-like protein 18 [Sycon ciliatum]|uniref:kelch-like protein 18 n=1 Tax=Sycon ciliatum TaxID=27933 RepID=UPI0020AE9257|eukprot:scpid45916/ scgid13956/ Kelch-like protein 3